MNDIPNFGPAEKRTLGSQSAAFWAAAKVTLWGVRHLKTVEQAIGLERRLGIGPARSWFRIASGMGGALGRAIRDRRRIHYACPHTKLLTVHNRALGYRSPREIIARSTQETLSGLKVQRYTGITVQ